MIRRNAHPWWLVALLGGASVEAVAGTYVPIEGPRDPTDAMDRPQGLVDPVVDAGALQLGMSPMFVHHARQGLELLYKREYAAFRGYFKELAAVFPGTAVQPIAEVLALQAMMLEDFSLGRTPAYDKASAQARAELTAALAQPGAEGWEHFMMAGVVGIESIHAARQERYVAALTLAFEAIDHAEQTREAAPSFVDLKLADGLYVYWRSALAGRIPMMGGYADRRDDGIAMIRTVMDDGVFLAPPARLALAFSWLEESRFDDAARTLEPNRVAYPGNLINEQVYGISLMYARRHAEALASFDRVLAIDPSARRVHYYRGVAMYRSKRYADAEASLTRYLGFEGLEDDQRAWALFRLGRVLEKGSRWGEAYERYREAVKADGHDGAKERIDHLRKRRRAGAIEF